MWKKHPYKLTFAFIIFSTFFIHLLLWPDIGRARDSRESALDNSKTLIKIQKLSVPFIPNQGQTDKRVKFYANTFGGTVFVTEKGEMIYSLPKVEQERKAIRRTHKTHKELGLKEELVGGRVKEVKAEEEAITRVSHFVGNDFSKWRSNIPTYGLVSLGEVYEGIEVKLKAYGRKIEKLFYVEAGADPNSIRLRLNGGESLRVNEGGELEVKTALGDLKFSKPVAYQEYDGKRIDVAVAYSLENAEIGNPNPDMTYGFKVGNYDRANNLIIDPLLASTFLGGSGTDFGIEIALDSAGNIIVAGVTGSSDFPTTSGEFDRTYNGGNKDIFVTKINSAGDAILFSTFIGGTNDEFYSLDSMELYRFGMAVDNSGNIYVTANTKSSDFPTTTGAYDRTFNGGDSDVFVTKLSSTGDNLVYSTFLGGSGSEFGGGIAVDGDGNAYVTGETKSADFPTTSGAYDRTYNGSGDIFVTKINPSGSNLIYSTYLGGSSWDEATDIAVDSSGNAYVLGGGGSANYPTTAGAFAQSYKGGGYDIYLTKLNSAGSGLVYSTFLGGNDREWATRLVVDNSGNAYVAGNTSSSDFPVTPGAYDTTFDENDSNGCSSNNEDGFIAKINSTGSGLLYSTFLSKAGVMGISVDGSGNAYVTGATCSSSFPTTPNAVDTTFNGVVDAIIAKINPTGNALLYSSYMGGSAAEYGLWIAIDSSGNIYITGITDSVDFPTQSPIQSSYGGGLYDAFVAKVDSSLAAPPNQYILTVSKSGTGIGTVTSSPAGINCGSDCSETYNQGTSVTLTATAASGSTFEGWSGDADCSDGVVVMNANKTCTATFNPQVAGKTLTVSKTGTGIGTVTSSPAGINCGSDCSETYTKVQKVKLTAKADTNSTFTGWSGGGCTGTKTCTVTVDTAVTVTASFALKTPDISVAQTALDFGSIKLGKKGTKTLKITNNGSGDLLITLSGLEGTDFSIQGSSTVTIKSKKSYSLKVSFKPNLPGSKTAKLEIHSNDPDTQTLEISLSGIGQ